MSSSVALCAFVAARSLADTLGFNEVSDRTATAQVRKFSQYSGESSNAERTRCEKFSLLFLEKLKIKINFTQSFRFILIFNFVLCALVMVRFFGDRSAFKSPEKSHYDSTVRIGLCPSI